MKTKNNKLKAIRQLRNAYEHIALQGSFRNAFTLAILLRLRTELIAEVF